MLLNTTLKFALAFGAIVAGSVIPVMLNADASTPDRFIELIFNAAVPVFCTTKLLLTDVLGSVPPKLVLLAADIVVVPVGILFPLPVTLISGAFTITENEQVVVLPDASVAVTCTGVVPIGKLEPLGIE